MKIHHKILWAGNDVESIKTDAHSRPMLIPSGLLQFVQRNLAALNGCCFCGQCSGLPQLVRRSLGMS